MKATKATARAAIADAIRTTRARISALTGDNPQIVAMRERNKGYLSALEDCALALDGNLTHLRITAQ